MAVAVRMAGEFKLPRMGLVVRPPDHRLGGSFDLITPFTITVETGGDTLGGAPHTDSADPGGFTKFGISQRYNPDIDVEGLDLHSALKILKERYWDKYNLDEIHSHVARFALFDFLVNSPDAAIRSAHAVAGVGMEFIDGEPTPRETVIEAINRTVCQNGVWEFVRELNQRRRGWIIHHSQKRFVAGLMNRVDDLYEYVIWLADHLENLED